MVLFLAESPLQVISCYELFKQKFSGERVLLVVKYRARERKKLMIISSRKQLKLWIGLNALRCLFCAESSSFHGQKKDLSNIKSSRHVRGVQV